MVQELKELGQVDSEEQVGEQPGEMVDKAMADQPQLTKEEHNLLADLMEVVDVVAAVVQQVL